ncbi:MAG: MDR/zinc-dependent alcohol dehydrogenase-like family protein [Anaerolineae bacterium]
MSESLEMDAAVVLEPGRTQVARVRVPEPGPQQVRIRLEGCGVCASNLPPWEGQPWFHYPMEPGQLGHECWGHIDVLGAEVQELKVGDRVTALSGHAYAEYDLAPADSVVVLPEALAGCPFPGEPLGCAMNIHARSGIANGKTVAIIGIGFLGALLTRLASREGARVLALSRRPWALEVARAMGASETIVMDDHWRIIDQVRELTDGAFCDQVIEATGKQWPLDLAAELTRERGRLIVAGYHQDGPRQVNMQLWNWRGLDVINAHERDPRIYVAGIRAAIDAVMRGDLDPWPLYTHRFTLDNLGQALNMTRDRPDGFLKALITY